LPVSDLTICSPVAFTIGISSVRPAQPSELPLRRNNRNTTEQNSSVEPESHSAQAQSAGAVFYTDHFARSFSRTRLHGPSASASD
jgi:hypothetical protein